MCSRQNIKIGWITALIVLSCFSFIKAQNIEVQSVKLEFQNIPLSEALSILSKRSGINIFFSEELVNQYEVSMNHSSIEFDKALTQLLYGKNIYFKKLNGQVVLYKAIRSQKKYTISGYVKDSDNGESLMYAGIYDFVTALGGETNEFGFYSVSFPEGEVDITYQYLGYKSVVERFLLKKDETINISLEPSLVLGEVTIYADSSVSSAVVLRSGATLVHAKELNFMPTLGGALDIYRYLEILPGISTGTDGVGGIHVRGGSNDQNLILMDGVPLYNPAHLIGIFSIFNPEAINQMEIYKANFPARYAGRLSSVLDVHTREGNNKSFSGSAKVGLASVNTTFEGPIIKDKSSFLVTGRWFLPSLVIEDLSRKNKEKNDDNGYTYLNFYDLNAKINYSIGKKDKFFASYFIGRDIFQDVSGFNTLINEDFVEDGETRKLIVDADINTDKNVNWGNQLGIVRWNHQWGDKIFTNSRIYKSSYNLQSVEIIDFKYSYTEPIIRELSGFDNQEFKTDISDIGISLDLDYMPSLFHRVRAGANLIRHTFTPKSISFDEEFKEDSTFIIEGQLENKIFNQFQIKSVEWGLFIEDDWEIIRDHLRINAGVHIAGFNVRSKSYVDPQVRFLLTYQPIQKLSVQFGFSKMTQYLHLLTNSSIGLPTDLWVPSTDRVKPQQSVQYSAAATFTPYKSLEVRVEGYYKKMKNLITYQEGASFLIPAGAIATSILDAGNWEDKVTFGKGESYGFESELSVIKRKWQGKASYAYSIANRTFEAVNNGATYPYRYNRKHTISISTQYKIRNRFSAKANFIFGTGNNITLAKSKFPATGNIGLFPLVGINFSDRNGFVLPAYHRLDVGFEYSLGKLSSSIKQHIFMDLYNVYDRENPFYVALTEDPITSQQSLTQYSIFRFLPSLGYSIKF